MSSFLHDVRRSIYDPAWYASLFHMPAKTAWTYAVKFLCTTFVISSVLISIPVLRDLEEKTVSNAAIVLATALFFSMIGSLFLLGLNLVFALLVMVVARTKSRSCTFRQAYLVGLFAMTPVLLLEVISNIVLNYTGVSLPSGIGFNIGVFLFFLYLNLSGRRMEG